MSHRVGFALFGLGNMGMYFKSYENFSLVKTLTNSYTCAMMYMNSGI